jgi:hypothetical protein
MGGVSSTCDDENAARMKWMTRGTSKTAAIVYVLEAGDRLVAAHRRWRGPRIEG